VYGAVLSTINYRQVAHRDRRKILGRIVTFVPAYGVQLGNAIAKVEAINAGYRAVTLTSIYLQGPNKARLFSTDSGVWGIEVAPENWTGS
jgi:hypothetical protein